MNKPTICFVARPDFLESPGGDTVQWRMYEQTAAEAGFATATWFGDERIPDADVYHAFNVDRPLEIYTKLRSVQQRKKPFVVSAIHHPNAWMHRYRLENPYAGRAAKILYRSFLGRSRSCVETLKGIASLVRPPKIMHLPNLWPGWRLQASWLLGHADWITALSVRELDSLEADFGCKCDPQKLVVIPNWVEGISGDGARVPDVVRSLPEPPVIVVGRIEARKNVLRICRLAESASRPTVFIGRANDREGGYEAEFRRCLGESRFVLWLPGVPREQMAGFYAHSCFLLNASYVEVSPLVDVEALLFGCPVATTRYALHHEYLPKGTPVCDPYDDQDILRILDWRPPRAEPFAAVHAAECKDKLISIYTQLSGGSRLHSAVISG